MSVIQNEVSIRALPNTYGSQSQQIKDLIAQFESTQQDRISNEQKNLVENINQHQISRSECDHLQCQLGNQSYTE